MALGTPIDGGAAYSAQNGTSVSPAYPVGISAGDCLVLIVGQKPSTANGGTVSTPSGWTLRGSLTAAGGYGTALAADTGNTNLFFYTKDTVTGSETGNLTVTVGTNNVCWGLIVNIPTDGGTLGFASATGQQSATPTASLSVSLSSASIQAQTGDMFLTAMCIPTDVTTPNQFTNANTGITGLTEVDGEVEEPDSGTGNDIGGFVGYSEVTAGSATGTAVFTATLAGTLTNVRGPVVTLRVRETLAPRTGTMAATETGSDDFTATGDVIVKGSLGATETGTDVFAASGTVQNPAITGTFAATETGTDTFAATAKLIVQGSLSVTEVGTDTLAATGDVIVKGSLAVTETGSDAFAATGDVFVAGSLAATETGIDVFSATGTVSDVITTGTMAAVETGSDSFSASGTVTWEPITGSLAAVETGVDTLAATGAVRVQGDLSATETGADVFAATGTVASNAITGDLAAVEVGTDSFSAAGKTIVQGSLAGQEVGLDIFAATGDEVSSGVMAATETGSDYVGSYVDDGYVAPGYVQNAIYGKVLVQGSFAATETGQDRARFLGPQPVVEEGNGRHNYFRPVREVTVRVEKSNKLAASSRSVAVKTTSSARAFGWVPGVRLMSKSPRVYRGIRVVSENGGVSGNTRAVTVKTDFNLRALPINRGLYGDTAIVNVTTTTAQIVTATTRMKKFGTSPLIVKTVTNPTDDELLAIATALKQARMKQIKSVMRRFR